MRWLILIYLAFGFVMPASSSLARDLVVDLSKPFVAITAGFTGSDLLLFGATSGTGDVVVIVRGPKREQIVRRKDRVMGIWINREAMTFDGVPDFYAVASNRPINEFIAREIQETYQIGTAHLKLPARVESDDPTTVKRFRDALIRNKQRVGLYTTKPGDLTFLGDRLFRTDLHFPANVRTGTYGIDVYLVNKGKIVSTQTTSLDIKKFGFEANVFSFAYRHSFAYGVLAVVIALMAGWLANVVFRKG